MPTVSIPWLNGGQPVAVRPMAVNGQREYAEASARYTKVLTAQANLSTTQFWGVCLQAKKMLDEKGAGAAKAAWDHTLKRLGMAHIERLQWPEATWAQDFTAYLEESIYTELETNDPAAAKKALDAKAKEAHEAWQAVEKDAATALPDLTLIELYWLVRATGARELTPPNQPPIPLSWKEEDLVATRKAIGNVGGAADAALIRAALVKGKDESRWEGDKPTTEEVVLGKASPPSEPSTPGSTASTPSSGPPMATIARSETNGALTG